jgi:hypothetical protein
LATLTSEWDANFVKFDMDHEQYKSPLPNINDKIINLQQLTLAANYLNIPSLLHLCLLKFAVIIIDKDQDDVMELLGIPKGSLDEKTREELIKENPWLFTCSISATTNTI